MRRLALIKDPPNDDRGWPATSQIPLTYGPLPDIA